MISENRLGYITNVNAGSGLIRCSGNIVPFENNHPKDSLYKLMTTTPGDSLLGGQVMRNGTGKLKGIVPLVGAKRYGAGFLTNGSDTGARLFAYGNGIL